MSEFGFVAMRIRDQCLKLHNTGIEKLFPLKIVLESLRGMKVQLRFFCFDLVNQTAHAHLQKLFVIQRGMIASAVIIDGGGHLVGFPKSVKMRFVVQPAAEIRLPDNQLLIGKNTF